VSGLLEHGLFDCVWSICQGRVEGSVTILHTLFVSGSPSYLHIWVACFGGPETARCRALLGLLEGDLLKLPASSNCAGDILFLSKNNAQALACNYASVHYCHWYASSARSCCVHRQWTIRMIATNAAISSECNSVVVLS